MKSFIYRTVCFGIGFGLAALIDKLMRTEELKTRARHRHQTYWSMPSPGMPIAMHTMN